MIQKDKGDLCGFVLVEVLCNMVTGILNRRLMSNIQYYDTLNGFHAGRGTGTTPLKTNLLQKMTDMKEEVIYEVFLDLYKYYNDLYQGWCLNILAAYGVVPWALRLLRQYWDCLSMVAWSEVYFGMPFKGHWGVTQGNFLSRTIFNVVVDAVLWQYILVRRDLNGPQNVCQHTSTMIMASSRPHKQ